MSTNKSTKHPKHGHTLSGAETIVQVLADEGVSTLFGYSGGAILPTYDAVFRHNKQQGADNIDLVVPANEQGAGFMAAGYARATGKVGVFMVTSGPGATNAVTPIRDCMADSIPVVLISGQVATGAIGTDAFQEAPIFNIMAPCAKQVYLVTQAEELEATVRTAFEVARSGRPGPVVIDIPKDVQNWKGKYHGKSVLEMPRYRKNIEKLQNNAVSAKDAQRLLKAMQKSSKPLVYAGGGVINSGASATLQKFCEKMNIPAVTTLMGIGALPTHHPLSLQMLGMHGTAYANYAVEDCDLLLAVGARFDDRVAGNVAKFAPNAKFVAHIDIDASEIGKVKKVDWHHISDANIALNSLIEYQDKHQIVQKSFGSWNKEIQNMKATHAMGFKQDGKEIQPQDVLHRINQRTKGQAIVSTGVGQHQMWAAQFFDFAGPRKWLTSGSMGTMGFGLPAAIGAQFGCKDAIVIDVDGDGSIRMNLGELETATTYNIPVKVLLLNNQGDGMVRQWQKLFYENRFSGSDKTLHTKDFVAAAKADGYGFAQKVTQLDQLDAALDQWLAFDGPAFLEVFIDREAEVYPMVGPGQSYQQMLTGPYIKGRAQPQTDTDDEDSGSSQNFF